MRRKTDAEFKAKVKSIVGDEYVPLDKYQNSKVKIQFKHQKCGNIFPMTPNSFFNGRRCPKCALKQVRFNNRKTDAEFKAEVKALVGNEYVVLGRYEKSNAKVAFRHKKCGLTFRMLPGNFLHGNRCPHCMRQKQGLDRQKTTAQFKKEVKRLVGEEYAVLGKYVNSRTKIEFLHKKCNNTFSMLPTGFLRGSRCPKCMCKLQHLKTKKTTDKFETEAKALTGNEYLILDQYKGAHKKIRFKHMNCGLIFEAEPSCFLHGQRCPKCSRKKRLQNSYKPKFEKAANKEYIMVSDYNGPHRKITVLHLKCGYLYKVEPYHFLRGERCPICARSAMSKKMTLSFKDAEKKVNQISNGQYRIMEKSYQNASTKAVFYHNKCKKKFRMLPTMFFSGQRCPFCQYSKGEKAIAEYLLKKEITFKTQFRIDNCRDKIPLPFDVAVFNKNGSLNCLIEYQGTQHFVNPFKLKKTKGIFNLQSVTDTQKHDAMKLQYCKENGIKLITINHPQNDSRSNTTNYIKQLVNRTLNKELHVV